MCPSAGSRWSWPRRRPRPRPSATSSARLIAEGKTKDEVKDALVAEYGENVLAVPGNDGFGLAAWLFPAWRWWSR